MILSLIYYSFCSISHLHHDRLPLEPSGRLLASP